MTATHETVRDRHRASVEHRLQQATDRLKVVQTSLDRAVAHEDRMFGRLDRRRSVVNHDNWLNAADARARLDNELHRVDAQVKQLEAQRAGLS